MYKYNAFISYSRAADSRLAPELKSALQNFAKPWYTLRAIQVFCDQTNLTANPDLWGAIENALQQSNYFIYLASPQAAQSKWVKKELQAFAQSRSANLIIVLTDGGLQWNDALNDFDWQTTTAVPRFDIPLFTHEPTWIDLTWIRKDQLTTRDPRFLDAIANLSAIVRGMDKDLLIGKDVEQHKRIKRFRLLSWLGLSFLAIFLTIATVLALISERRSQQRLVATFTGNGNALLEAGDYTMALPWYIEAMANDRDKRHSAMHQTRVQNFFSAVPSLQQVWHTALPVLFSFFADTTHVAVVSGDKIDWGINEFTCFTNGTCRGKIQLLNRQTGKDVFTPIATIDGIRTANINPAGTLLATISVSNMLRLYALQNGALLWQVYLQVPGSSVPDDGQIAFNPATNTLLALTQGKMVVCDINTGQVAGRYSGRTGYLGKAFFLKTANEILVLDDGLQVWNYRTNTKRTLAIGIINGIDDVALSPDGARVALAGTITRKGAAEGSGRSVVAIANLHSLSQPVWVKDFELRGLKMIFSPDGNTLAANSSLTTEGGSSDLGTTVWNTNTGEALIPWIKMAYEVNIRFSARGDAFILTSNDGTTQVWQLPAADDYTSSVHQSILLHDGNTGQPSEISSDEYMLTISNQRLLKLWRLPRVEEVYQAIPPSTPVDALRTTQPLSWDVVTGTLNDSLPIDSSVALIVDTKSGKPIGKPLQLNSRVYQAIVSPTGKQIAVMTEKGVIVWSPDTRKLLYDLPVSNSGTISSLEFNIDGTKILTGHFNYTARIWNAVNGKPLTPFMRHPFSATVNDILYTHFSADEQWVITKDYDTYRVWDATTGQPVSTAVKANTDYAVRMRDTTAPKPRAVQMVPTVQQMTPENIALYGALLCGCVIEDSGGITALSETDYANKWAQWKDRQKK